MLQPGYVLVVDLYGMAENGNIVDDNLFYYVMKTTKTGGIVVDGAIRDLEGIREMDMPLYYKKAHPSYLTNVTLTGINIPVRIGNATVMPGDVVVGDPEGIYFVPPQMVEQVITSSDTIHIHDEWTRKKFDEGKYKSSEIYSSPKDPALRKEYQDYLAARLAEIKKKYEGEKKYRGACFSMPSLLNPSELRHSFFNRAELLDERKHCMLRIIQILRLLQHIRGMRLRDYRDAVFITDDIVAGIHLHARARHRDVDAGEAEVTNGGGRHDAPAEYRELQTANLRGIANAAVHYRCRQAAKLHRGGHQCAQSRIIGAILQHHHVH